MILNPEESAAIALTLTLATVTVSILILVGTPLACWLASTKSRLKAPIASIVALPLVLPPTVIGFYLLVAMGPEGPLGRLFEFLELPQLAFSFGGLVVGSVIYSLPFVVHPIQNAVQSVDTRLLESAATLGAGRLDRFFSITLPLARSGFLSALILGFAHTLGEFGVVLMIGGNIPGETQVLSVLLYEQVELFNYERANQLALMLLVFSFTALFLLYASNGRARLFSEKSSERVSQ